MEWMKQLRVLQIPSPLLYCDCIGICGNVRATHCRTPPPMPTWPNPQLL